MQNILTFDVEDWYDLSGRLVRGAGVPRPERLAAQLEHVLELLGRHRCRATFFCLGSSLANTPELVRQIAAAGHEIGTHGWGHELVSRIGLPRFRDDLLRSMCWLQDTLGRRVAGYRAPAFSVPPEHMDKFYDICLDVGLAYDSSVFPIRGSRYGVPDAPREPHVARTAGGRRLFELPLSTVIWAGRAWPVAGGGYWRVLPSRCICAAIRRVNADGRPMVTYLHPYELDPQPLSASQAAGRSWRSFKHGLKQNLGRRSIYAKLDHVLASFRFGAAEDYLREYGTDPTREQGPHVH